MASARRRTLSYTVWSAAPLAGAGFVLVALLGKAGLTLVLLLTLPWLSWRYDNATGTFLPLSILLLFLFGVLGLLLVLMAIVLR